MPRIIAKPDSLDELNANFIQQRLEHNVFLNSVPKCGTHLIRNIFRMFVSLEQQYTKAFIQLPVLEQHQKAFDPRNPELSWGHLIFNDVSAMVLHETRKLILVRDPYDWVIARARFFMSDNFIGKTDVIRSGRITVEELLNLMVFGIYGLAPTLEEVYSNNAVAWLGTDCKLVRLEDLMYHIKHLDTVESENYFSELLSILGQNSLPEDWRERVCLGADPAQSSTYRDNLTGIKMAFPTELPDMQKRLVDYAVPGLRQLLGYT